jgi:hypothetical protein
VRPDHTEDETRTIVVGFVSLLALLTTGVQFIE